MGTDVAQIVYATESDGVTLLNPAPEVVIQPELTNIIKGSQDWEGNGGDDTGGIVSLAATDLKGVPNAAMKVVGNGSNNITSVITSKPSNGLYSFRVFFNKTGAVQPNGDNDQLVVSFLGGVAYAFCIDIAATTASVASGSAESFDTIETDKYFVVYGVVDGTAGSHFRLMYLPGYYNSACGAALGAKTNTVEILQTELYEGSLDVGNFGPIFTTTTAVTTDAVQAVFDADNLNNDTGVLFIELDPWSIDQDIIGNGLAWTNPNFVLTDSAANTVSVAGTAGQSNKIGIVLDSANSEMYLYVNGSWSAATTYSGTFDATDPLEMGENCSFKNLNTGSDGTVAQRKSWVEALAA